MGVPLSLINSTNTTKTDVHPFEKPHDTAIAKRGGPVESRRLLVHDTGNCCSSCISQDTLSFSIGNKGIPGQLGHLLLRTYLIIRVNHLGTFIFVLFRLFVHLRLFRLCFLKRVYLWYSLDRIVSSASYKII